MTYQQFTDIIESSEHPVILVEGTRSLPESDIELLASFTKKLANKYPDIKFRTGNADGSDSAFAKGVCEVDATKLEYILPYAGHRKKHLHKDSYHVALNEIPPCKQEETVGDSLQASPKYKNLMDKRKVVPRLKAQANYILRDTLKVVGAEELKLKTATVGIFYVNSEDSMKGGTGHTIRVCRDKKIPVAFQEEWMKWEITHSRKDC
jgi:hypothetical protein